MSKGTDDRLDRLAASVSRAGGIGDKDAEKIGSERFLFTRILARIESDRRSSTAQRAGWFTPFPIAVRAIAVLFLVTIGAAVAFWFSRANPTVHRVANSAADNVGRVVTGGACALSATDECAISTEEVLATLFAEEGGKEPK